MARAPDSRSGRALLWPGRAIYVGPLLEHEAHAHHAIQISFPLHGTVLLQVGPDPRWSSHRAVATAPDQPHRIRCDGLIAQVYLDPESAGGLALRERIGGAGFLPITVEELHGLSEVLSASSASWLDAERVARAIDDLTRTVTPASSHGRIDRRVEGVLRIVEASPGHRSSLSELAERVALSPSRLGALFRRDIGIPLRRYLLWLRLIDAVETILDGRTLTEAAHDSGFSDSAHLSRTFRRMFGMPPSVLRRGRIEIRRFAGGPSWTPTR
jgi:AraC-like DNA-binding protein